LSRLMRETLLNPEQKKLNDNVILSGESLLGIISEILDFSKIEAGKIALEAIPFSIREVMKRVYSFQEHTAEEKMITLTSQVDQQIPSALIGDPVRLQQILVNLVSNALKFTHSGGVAITCDLVGLSGGKATLLFAVTDTGIGINTENLKNIFEKFRQEDESVTRSYGGTGLGLAISQQLVNLMGGVLKVESEKGKGSRFFFIIEFMITDTKVLQKTKKTISYDSLALADKKILVVEDNEFNQFIVKSILEKWGSNVEIADNGQTAVGQLWLSDYDLILMDMQMPVMDGLTATRIIRNELNKSTPIIALTANVTKGAIQRAFEAGMNEYISKPFDEEDLYLKVLNALGKEPVYVTEDPGPKDNDEIVQEKEELFYDLTYLKKFLSDNDEQIQKILIKFTEYIPGYYQAMLTAYEDKAYVELTKASHKLQSSIDLLARQSLRETIRQIHDYSRDQKQLDQLERLFAELKITYPVLITQLEKLINEMSTDNRSNQ